LIAIQSYFQVLCNDFVIEKSFNKNPNILFTNNQIVEFSVNRIMTCKEGFIHSFAYFAILDSVRCTHCGLEKEAAVPAS